MKALPSDFDEGELFPALAEGWGLAVESIEYQPVGFGSYHWTVVDNEQQRFFATVDELNLKGWLGSTADAAFAGLAAAFDTAVALRDRGGLDFVLAPTPTLGGDSLHRLSARHSLALFPFVDGTSGDFGGAVGSRHRADLVRLLAELHSATPMARTVARPVDLDFPGRDGLEAAIADSGRPWRGGPFAEPARSWLLSHAADLRRLLSDFDGLLAEVRAAARARVVTHGEPHPGNVMHRDGRLVLLDWDTVGLALPERDLWSIATASGEEVARYTDLTGHEVSPAAMSLYGRAWDLSEIAAFVDVFRAPHHRTQDTEQAWRGLEEAFLDCQGR